MGLVRALGVARISWGGIDRGQNWLLRFGCASECLIIGQKIWYTGLQNPPMLIGGPG